MTNSSITGAVADLLFNRELSWIRFNARVLHEALDERTPLLERLKFLAIFSSNLDEFFMVRVAVIKQQIEAGVTTLTPDGLTPQAQLAQIHTHLRPLIAQQHQCFTDVLCPRLATEGIHICHYPDLEAEQQAFLESYFRTRIFPVLTPLAVDPGHPFPYISNLSLSLAVEVYDPLSDQEHFARIKVPPILPRFVQVGTSPVYVPLEQVIAHNLDVLFEGMVIRRYYPFRLTRDADLAIEEEEAADLLEAIQQELRKRRIGGSAVRLEVVANTPHGIITKLQQELGLADDDVYYIDGLLNLKDLMSFMAIPRPDLKDERWPSALPPELTGNDEASVSIFDQIKEQGTILLHHPYHSFSRSVLRFIEEAADDPQVLSIKQTLYRTSGDSPIVGALIRAAENGKQVAVLVELKARFDEENNILWAKKLEKAGVHVVYGLVGLKTHAKTVLVVRQENAHLQSYVHIGTGNYNPKTARLYTDIGILSCDQDLAADLIDLFNFLTGYARQRGFRQILVAPTTLRSRFVELIRREIAHHQATGNGHIIAKMNSLVDPKLIEAVYEAGRAGVKVELIIRGMCCLKPGIPGESDNVRVISIIGRLLEHARIFYFANGGEPEFYIGSADWMTRNMDRRVEVVSPVRDRQSQQELWQILQIMLADNRQAWELAADGTYSQRHPTESEASQPSQYRLSARARGLDVD